MAGCNSCSTTTGTSGGCQNNGTCGTSDCNKMNAFDWLSHMGIPTVDKFDIVEIKFKGGRKDYYRNVDHVALTTGDPVVLDVPNGHHIGYVSLQGELVRLQMQKRKVRDDDNILKIYRVANQKDLDKWEEARNREVPTLYRGRQIIDELKLQMKLSDIEYQADNSKATFYYSADDRVDFRELIKLLAGEFKIRVEMRQISLRQEAGRLGGIGVCGRELCCSTWIHDFKSVSTAAARYQNLSLNPGKLSGQCGRLKCCLNYELDTYMSALKDVPTVDRLLQTETGGAKLQKTDIFRKLMWFSYNNENNWHSISCERVKEILELNEKGIQPFDLNTDKAKDYNEEVLKSTQELERLDKKFSVKKKKKKPRTSPEGSVEGSQQRTAPNPPREKDSSQQPNEQDKNRPRPNKNRNQNRRNPSDPNRQNRPKRTDSTPDPNRQNRPKRADDPSSGNTGQQGGEKPNPPKNKNRRNFPPRNKGNQGNNE